MTKSKEDVFFLSRREFRRFKPLIEQFEKAARPFSSKETTRDPQGVKFGVAIVLEITDDPDLGISHATILTRQGLARVYPDGWCYPYLDLNISEDIRLERENSKTWLDTQDLEEDDLIILMNPSSGKSGLQPVSKCWCPVRDLLSCIPVTLQGSISDSFDRPEKVRKLYDSKDKPKRVLGPDEWSPSMP